MKDLPTISCISYLTGVEGVVWRREDYDTNRIIKWLKGETTGGYLRLTLEGKERIYKDEDSEDFVTLLCKTVAAKLQERFPGSIALVPVPNSNATVADPTEFRTLAIARRIAAFVGPQCSVDGVLRWKTPMQSSRRGGTRDPQVLFDNLHLSAKPNQPVVLLDDVITTGAHLVACCRKLIAARVTPTGALVIGQAIREQKPKMVEWQEYSIPIEARPATWDF